MISVKVTYNGRSFNSLTDAVEQAYANGLKKLVEKKIQPVQQELMANGGSVEVVIGKNFQNYSINVLNTDTELTQKVVNLLKQ